MKTVVWVKGDRGLYCLQEMLENDFPIALLVLQPQAGQKWYEEAIGISTKFQIPTYEPEDPNSPDTEGFLRSQEADLFVLAGYGKILKPNIIGLPKKLCINLHGGRLPQQRGSSPLNWSLILGQDTFGISVIRVDAGVDTGEVILSAEMHIEENDTIRELHEKANREFPKLLMQALELIRDDAHELKVQDEDIAAYYPLRFPDDGFILWDMLTAQEIHNRIRALTTPYPCAFTYFGNTKVKLIESRLRKSSFFGEPGRVYLKRDGKLLVCARDKCLWITQAVCEDTGLPLAEVMERYECLATVRGAALAHYQNGKGNL